MTSLEDKIVHWLMVHKEWTAKGLLTRSIWHTDHGVAYQPETVGRALREAESKKRIAVKYKGKNTQYKWIPHEMRARYIPTSERKDDTLFTSP